MKGKKKKSSNEKTRKMTNVKFRNNNLVAVLKSQSGLTGDARTIVEHARVETQVEMDVHHNLSVPGHVKNMPHKRFSFSHLSPSPLHCHHSRITALTLTSRCQLKAALNPSAIWRSDSAKTEKTPWFEPFPTPSIRSISPPRAALQNNHRSA